MPVFQSSTKSIPDWCELHSFEIVQLAPGETHSFERRSPKEKLIVAEGSCAITFAVETVDVIPRANLDLPEGAAGFVVSATQGPTILIWMSGIWGDQIGGSGQFSVDPSDQPNDSGDPHNYPQQTNFDRHYHDCDEYWIIYGGRGVAYSEEKRYEIKAGDCVATGMGHHHDIPIVYETIKGVYFETTLEGQKRLGHLWDHRHGIAQPKMDRT
jgi:mannose-6-phosphate isomerase-like protein (cupin superfamily)